MKRTAVAVLAGLALVAFTTADRAGKVPVEIKSLGAMAFGPNNTLFIGDSEAGAILAIDLSDKASGTGAINIEGIDARVAAALGTTAAEITINDLAVHPVSHNIYLTVTRGRGAGAQATLLRVQRDGRIEPVDLSKAVSAPIPNAPASNPGARRNPRTFTVTDLAFADGQIWVAGLSNEEFSSAFRRMPYPFKAGMQTTTLEIYHVSHGQNETNAPVMTFLPQRVAGKQYVLAAYTCTPLVAFEAESLKDKQHVFGRTVAELGAGNQPLDMISLGDAVLIANSRHPMMKVSLADIASGAALKSPTREEGIKRVPLSYTGIRQLADLDQNNVIVIQAGTAGLDLKSIAKSSL